MSKRKFDVYEKRISEKRREEVNGTKKAAVPSHIQVQRMFGKPNLLKKFELLDTRSYDELSIENLKEACESFFDMPPGTCDALLIERAQFCFLTEQITGKKLYMVRFVDADKSKERGQQSAPQA